MKILKVSPDFQDLVPVSHSLTQYQHQSACMTWGNGEDFELGDSSQINVATVVTYWNLTKNFEKQRFNSTVKF